MIRSTKVFASCCQITCSLVADHDDWQLSRTVMNEANFCRRSCEPSEGNGRQHPNSDETGCISILAARRIPMLPPLREDEPAVRIPTTKDSFLAFVQNSSRG